MAAKVGRKPVVHDPETCKKSAERFAGARRALGLTQEALAEALGISVAMTRNYERGYEIGAKSDRGCVVSRRIAERLERLTGTCWPYYTGETDICTWDELVEENEVWAPLRAQAEVEQQRKALFSAAGFEFREISVPASVDFAEVGSGAPTYTDEERAVLSGARYAITDPTSETIKFLTDTQLNEVLDKVLPAVGICIRGALCNMPTTREEVDRRDHATMLIHKITTSGQPRVPAVKPASHTPKRDG